MNRLVLTGNTIRLAHAPRLRQKVSTRVCKRLEHGVDQRGLTTDLFMTSSAGDFHLLIGCSFFYLIKKLNS